MKKEYKRTQKVCEQCSKSFWIYTCYLKRPTKQGRFCSNICRNKGQFGNGNPNTSELSKIIGPKAAREYKYKEAYAVLRKQALEIISNNGKIVCVKCNCDYLPLLQVNHINGGGNRRKESGTTLWRMVIKLGTEAKKYFDIRCGVCNWVYFIERRHPEIKYEVKFEQS